MTARGITVIDRSAPKNASIWAAASTIALIMVRGIAGLGPQIRLTTLLCAPQGALVWSGAVGVSTVFPALMLPALTGVRGI